MRLERYALGNIQIRRSRISKTLKRAPYCNSSRKLYSRIPASTNGNCNPMSMNTRPFSTKVSESHTAHAWIRTFGEKKCELCRLKYNPHATTANTPEECIASGVLAVVACGLYRSEEHTSELQ